MTNERCQGQVFHASGMVRGWGRHIQCSKRATKEGYCGIHHPDAVAKRQAATEERLKAESERLTDRWKREARDRAIVLAVLALTPDERATLPQSVRDALAQS